jgi:hypothetical protein
MWQDHSYSVSWEPSTENSSYATETSELQSAFDEDVFEIPLESQK